MNISELNHENWLIFAIRNYNNPLSVTYSDFEEDLKRFKYIKRLLRRYETTGELKTHLILNHVIVLYNVFDEAATPLLFYRVEACLLYTSPSPRDKRQSRMPSSA